MLCAVVAACGGSNLVQHSPPQSFSREPEPKTIAVLPPAPRLDAINQTTVTDGTGIELVGSGFEDGAVAELLAANGSIIGSVAVAGDAVRRTAVLPAGSVMIAPAEARAFVPTTSSQLPVPVTSPGNTVYLNLSAVVPDPDR